MIAQKTNKISHTVLVRTRHVLPKSEQYAGTKKQVFERLHGWDRQGELCYKCPEERSARFGNSLAMWRLVETAVHKVHKDGWLAGGVAGRTAASFTAVINEQLVPVYP